MVEVLTNSIAPVLAASDEDIGKVIFGVVAAVIWAVSAFVSWANKKSQETKRRAEEEMMRRAAQAPPRPPPMSQPSRQRIAEGIAARYPDVLLPPAPQREAPRMRQGPIPPPVPQMRPVPAQQRPKRRRPHKPIPVPPPVPQTRREEELEQAQLLDETPVRRDTRAQSPRAVRTLTPQGLRNQLIWMEILQPPLALRDELR